MSYKEYYDNQSLEVKAWRSKASSLSKSIKKLEKHLAPFLDGHFEGRIYVGTTLIKINKLKALKEQLEYLKANRPINRHIEKKIKIRKKRTITYTYENLLDRFEAYPSTKRASILETALYYMQKGTSNQKYICIFMAMGYKQIENELWVKN